MYISVILFGAEVNNPKSQRKVIKSEMILLSKHIDSLNKHLFLVWATFQKWCFP